MKKSIDIIFENEYFVAVNKAAGMLSVPDRMQSETSLKDILIEKYGSIFTVHRLDKETSGIILFAKDEATHKYLSKAFEEKTVEKYYVGLVHGIPPQQSGSIDGPIMEHPIQKGLMIVNRKGKPSLTTYEVLKDYKLFSWIKFRIHTGRMHQIRVHSKHIGHPIVCDSLYGDGKPVLLSSFKKKYKLSKNELDETPILSRYSMIDMASNFLSVADDDL